MARATTSRPAVSSTTTTITLEDPSSQLRQQPETIVLRLSRPPSRKKVTWKEGTVDNEFLQRKSSKKCCIFNKQKSFDEDDSDDDDHDHKHESGPSNKDTHDSGGGCCSKDSGEGLSGEGSSASCSGEK